MAPRPPSVPPTIRGFDHVKLLGSGGFADVFLYQQRHPRREVAVKVLLKDRVSAGDVDGFTEEANLMAQLANHPSIVSVYEAGVSDDGRPYLVMEYCSRPNLQARHKRERFSEAETLRIGVQIAGAVETAHRAGIIHRDIKPANILVTAFGRPALTDFGISATTSGEMVGMSIPWSPPEAFRVPPVGNAASDVYSLAATLFTLLTNRSPYEIPGASNTQVDVMGRIQSMPVPSTGRSDVSPSLESVLSRAMAKAPEARFSSALEFAYALQRVQIELGMQPTTVDVVEDELALAEEEDDEEGRTRFSGITSIDAQRAPVGPAPSFTASTAPGSAPLSERTVARIGEPLAGETIRRDVMGAPPAAPVADTQVRAAPMAEFAEPSPAPKRRGPLIGWLVGAGVVVVGGVVALAMVLAPQGANDPRESATVAAPVDAVGEAATVPDVTDPGGSIVDGSAMFTWTNPAPEDGDTYLWRPVVPGQSFAFEEATEPTATIAADAAGQACVEVLLRRANGTSADEGVEWCVP